MTEQSERLALTIRAALEQVRRAEGEVQEAMSVFAATHGSDWMAVLLRLTSAALAINESRLILTLLDASGSEAALREVEYQQQKGAAKP